MIQSEKDQEMIGLEHVNVTVADPDQTAALLCGLFGWSVRWSGPGMETGRTVHVGTDKSYVALFSYGKVQGSAETSYRTAGAMNHIGVVVDDLDGVEKRVKAAGFTTMNHSSYDPGRRFYFREGNGVEIEVVSYS
jgi:catechol 2,3-dioxygenase-like lactoylglutathione lyase family enzyme